MHSRASNPAALTGLAGSTESVRGEMRRRADHTSPRSVRGGPATSGLRVLMSFSCFHIFSASAASRGSMPANMFAPDSWIAIERSQFVREFLREFVR